MTETEAALLADRLARVWGGKSSEFRYKPYLDGDGIFSFVGAVSHQIEFRMQHFMFGGYAFILKRGVIGQWYTSETGRLDCRLDDGEILIREEGGSGDGTPQAFAEFAAQWLPFFRRGVFLSGCTNIEATQHERLGWAWEAKERGVLTPDECAALLMNAQEAMV